MWDGAFFLLGTLAGLALGFILPGFLISRLLVPELHASLRLATAFIISLLLLFHLMFWSAVIGLPLRPAVIWPMELLVAAGLAVWVVALKRGKQPMPVLAGNEVLTPIPAEVRTRDAAWWILIVMAVLTGAMLLMRTSLWPLAGADNAVRWDYLATRILKYQTLSFYPPVADEDFQRYFYIDGIPPLLSFAYWWMYGSAGRHATGLTSIFVVAQYAAIAVFVYGMGRTMHSPRAGLFAVGALASSTLFTGAVALGQETGFTALALVAMMYFLARAREFDAEKRWPWMILAGLAAALGALSREYGWAFVILGAVAVFWMRLGWRMAAIFCLTAILLASPWYIRTLVRSGNPLYNNRFGPFWVNPVQAGILDLYVQRLGVSNWTLGNWVENIWSVFQGAPLQFTAGLVGAVWLIRKWGFLLLAAIVVTVLWIQSIGYTNGGIDYSRRVMTPVIAILSVLSGVVLARVAIKPAVHWVCTTLLLIVGVWGLVAAAFHPYNINLAQWAQFVFSVPPKEVTWRDELPQVVPAGSSILTDNPYVAVALEGTSIQAIPVWSPKLRFLLDNSIPPKEARQRVQQLGIGYVIVENHINLAYLAENMRFYSQDSAEWKVIAQVPGVVGVYELPAASPAK